MSPRPAPSRLVPALALLLTCATAGPAAAQVTGAHGSQHVASPSPSAPEAALATAHNGRVQVVAGPGYEVGSFRRWLFGDGYRDIWLTPIEVPILDLGAVSGGLTPVEQGGNQSLTLHFDAADGRRYVFRTVDKPLDTGFHDDLKHTFVGGQVQDLISSYYPASSVFVTRLLDPTGILHADAWIYVLPDDERLGEFRSTFANLLGTVELVPDEGENGEALFAGSTAIKGTEEFLADLDSSSVHQINAHRYLKARFIDLLLNDSDRGADQWRWARLDDGDGYLWEPIPRDRDWALLDAQSPVFSLVRKFYAKPTPFQEEFHSQKSLTLSSWSLDRRLLADLDWSDWQREIAAVQSEISDDAIATALTALPEPWRQATGGRIAQVIRARRENLEPFARAYYELLSFEPDVHGSDDPERLEADRLAGGDVRIRLYRRGESTPYFDRTFHEQETREVRVYLDGGDDEVVVGGDVADGSVILRIVTGDGDDTLIDQGQGGDGRVRTAFYDDEGRNRVTRTPLTLFVESSFDRSSSDTTYVSRRLQEEQAEDWGGGSSIRPQFSYGDAAGAIVGASWVRERKGFRTDPYRYRAEATFLIGIPSGRPGGALRYSRRFTSSRIRFDIGGALSQFESLRFFGFGNESPLIEGFESLSLVEIEQVNAEILAVLELGSVDLGAGPILRYTDLRPVDDAPLEKGPGTARIGGRAFAMAEFGGPTLMDAKFEGHLRLESFPAMWDLDRPVTSIDTDLEALIPIPVFGRPPRLVLRTGGRHVWGVGFPVDESAFVGGRKTLRGYRHDRFAGRSMAFGSAELRLPLFELELLTRGRFGVLGFEDVGRVWWDGEESGQWHTGHGAGIWFESIGFEGRFMIGKGEETRYYFGLSSQL